MSKREVCKFEYECKGNCWVNVAGDLEVWKTISKHCRGTKREQYLLADIFYNKKPFEELFKIYEMSEEEKFIVKKSWRL